MARRLHTLSMRAETRCIVVWADAISHTDTASFSRGRCLVGQELQGKKVAILVDNGFEQVELTGPKQALEAAGARTEIVSPQATTVRGWDDTDWGSEFAVDVPLERARSEDFDALVLPG